MNFTETEESMHTDIMLCYNNWSTPLAIAQLLKKLHTENILTKEHFAFLETAMLDCVWQEQTNSGVAYRYKIWA